MVNIKPVAGIKSHQFLQDIYWRQFKTHHNFLEKNPKNFEELLLSALFLCITFEAFINYAVEFLLENVNRQQNRGVQNFYVNNIQNSPKLKTKFDFLVDIFVADQLCLEEKKTIHAFINNKWTPLRNKIAHGSEFWILRWSDGRTEKSSLASKLSVTELDSVYSDFANCMNCLYFIFEKIDMDELISGSNRDFILNCLKLSDI